MFPAPARRARRRLETPPGAQIQADWAVFPDVWLGGARRRLLAFVMRLSFSRAWALVWSERRDLLAWLTVYNAAFVRLCGALATVRIDNEKTAIVAGVGARDTRHLVYQRFAATLRFHIDACAPRSPEAKGKVERRIRDGCLDCSPYRQHWNTLAEFQAATDEAAARLMARRTCPATGTAVAAAWANERAVLGPLPAPLPKLFDVVVTHRVAADCTMVFEDRTYSVPFRLIGRRVEIRGGAHDVQVLHDATIVATHPRAAAERIVLDPAHYEGPSTATVTAPMPLGRLLGDPARRDRRADAAETPARPVCCPGGSRTTSARAAKRHVDLDATVERLQRAGLAYAERLPERLGEVATDVAPHTVFEACSTMSSLRAKNTVCAPHCAGAST